MKKGNNGNRARIDHDVGVFGDFEIMCLVEKMDKINTQVRNFNTVVGTMQMKKMKNTISEINFSMGIRAG